MSTQPKPFLTAEQYLEIERKAEFKSEYHDGEMFAMSGGSRYHDRVTRNATLALTNRLSDSCELYTSNMRVHTPETGLYTYPDLSIVCGEQQFLDDVVDTLINPVLIVEVLSKSTEAYDRGDKFASYRSIDSLQGCLFLAQDKPAAELFVRGTEGKWIYSESIGFDAMIDIPFLRLTVPLAEIYKHLQK